MPLYTTNANDSFLPAGTGDLVELPFYEQSVFAQVTTRVSTSGNTWRCPIVSADPTAAWTNEGAEIALSQPTLAELEVTPAKLASLVVVSSELANDSNPAAAELVGRGIARDISRKFDQAMFSAAGLASPAPAGLGTLSGIATYVNASAWTNSDFMAEAKSKLAVVGATLTHMVVAPATALSLDKVKQATGSNAPLLGLDATSPTERRVLGVPIVVNEYVAANVGWGIDSSKVYTIVRSGSELKADASAFFSSDRIGVRGTMRVCPAFPMPTAVCKVSIA